MITFFLRLLLAPCCLVFFSAAAIWAQNDVVYEPFVALDRLTDPSLMPNHRNVQVLELRPAELQRMFARPARQLRIRLPETIFPNLGGEVVLERNDVLMNDFRLSAITPAGVVGLPVRPSFHYQGRLSTPGNSVVAFSLFADHLVMVLADESANYTLAPAFGQATGTTYYLANDSELELPFKHGCGLADAHYAHAQRHPAQLRGTNTCKVVRIYYEADFSLYTANGSSVQATADYVLAMHNAVDLLYANENIRTAVSEIRVYTALDPYAGLPTYNDVLTDFNTAMSGGFNGNLAHFVSNVFRGGTVGVAYVGVLCAPNAGNRTGTSYVETTYGAVPSYSETVTTVAHELGHNFSSSHTQRCGTWGLPGLQRRYDDCYTDEGAGNCTPLNVLAAGSNLGSIMSYCQSCSNKCGGGPAGVSLTVGFGDLPGDTIRVFYENASCIACPCTDAWEYNNTRSTAAEVFDVLDETNFEKVLAPTLHAATDEDFFLLRATQPGNLSLRLLQLPEDYDLQVLNEAGAPMGSSTNSGTANELVGPLALVAGDTVFVRVFPKNTQASSCSPYSLLVNWASTESCSSPGTDSTVLSCNTVAALNLFNQLGGIPVAGGTFSDDDATGALSGNNFNTTLVPPGSYDFTYTLPAAGGCAARSATVSVDTRPCSYCAAGATTTGFMFISRSSFSNLSFSGGTDVPTYQDRTNLVANVERCTTYPVQVGVTVSFGAGDRCTAWVDWNRDGDFADAGEATSMPFNGGTFTYNANITVPATAVAGYYRMRIRLSNIAGPLGANAAQPCNNATYGVVHDYSIRVNSEPTFAVGPASQGICLGGEAVVELANSQVGARYQVFEGATPLGTALISEGGVLRFVVPGLSVGTHTLMVRQVLTGPCSHVDMANAVTVEVSNTAAGGPASSADPGNMLGLNISGLNNEFVLVPHHPLLNLSNGANGFTVSAWVRPTNPGTVQIILSKDEVNNNRIDYQIGLNAAGRFTASIHNGPLNLFGATVVSAGSWYHVAIVKDVAAGQFRLYVNGIQEGSLALAGAPFTSSDQPLCIGRRVRTGSTGAAAENYFRGYIDEVVLHNTALTQQQVSEQMHLVRRGCNLGVVAYWQFNETEPDTLISAYNGLRGLGQNTPLLDPSTLAVGQGTSTTMIVAAGAGTYAFAGTDVTLNYTANAVPHSVVVSQLAQNYNTNTTLVTTTHPSLQTLFSSRYWVINAFGAGLFSTNASFANMTGVPAADQAAPANLKYISRPSRAFGAWNPLVDGASYMVGTNTVTFNGITGFSQITLGSTTSSTLPVELLNLTATPSGANRIAVKWQTQHEQNNAGFWIEMMAPEREHFSGVRFVNSQGATGSYVHELDELTAGRYRFRLRQVDFDGTERLSHEVEAVLEAQQAIWQPVLFPNPNSGSFSLGQLPAGVHTATMTNLLGQRVWQGKVTGPEAELQLHLPVGIYTLSVQGAQPLRMVVE